MRSGRRKSPVTHPRYFDMETTLAADCRHLALPDSCLFAPTELVIGSSLSQNEFSRLGTALASVDQASDLWACDYALAGRKRWGAEGLKLASTATRLSVCYLKRSASIAERFDPSRRFPNLTREHYRGLCCFPVEFTDAWLPTVCDKGFGAKTLRALAVEAYGSDPKASYSKNKKKRSIALSEILYSRLKESSPIPKTAVFIEEVLTDWANNATPEQTARVAAALSTRDADKVRSRRKEKKVETLDNIETSRPIYAERRSSQLAEGASPIPVKKATRRHATTNIRGRFKSRIKIVFTECPGPLFAEQGGTERLLTKSGATRFNSLEMAEAAAREYSVDRGYACEVFHCERCNVYHVRGRDYGAHAVTGLGNYGQQPTLTAPRETLDAVNTP
jgi:hypothetical protein